MMPAAVPAAPLRNPLRVFIPELFCYVIVRCRDAAPCVTAARIMARAFAPGDGSCSSGPKRHFAAPQNLVAIGGIADKQGQLALPASAAIDPTETLAALLGDIGWLGPMTCNRYRIRSPMLTI